MSKREGGKTLDIKNGIAIGAEISTILTLILTWLMYQQSNNSAEGASISPVLLVVLLIVDVALILIFAGIIIRSLFIKTHKKPYQLEQKCKKYIESDSKYLSELSEKNKEILLGKMRKALKELDENKAFDQDVYYMLLYALFYSAQRNINIVSILDDNEWVDTPEEDEFLRVNLAVSERKVHLNRIFVVNRSDIKDKLNTASIRSFIQADHAYIHLFVVLIESLARNQLNDIASGFIVFDDFAVACDIFSDNEIRGTLKFDDREIEFYNKTYMRLNEYLHPINKEFLELYFPDTNLSGEEDH